MQQVRGTQVRDGSIGRADIDASTAGNAVIRKLLAGSNVSITSTGVDAGTGDVTINVTAGTSGFTPITKTASFTPTLAEVTSSPLYLVNTTSAVVVTIPSNANVANSTGAIVQVRRDSTGTVTLTPDTGVTIRGDISALSRLYSAVSIIQSDVIDTWDVFGQSPITEVTVDFGSVFVDAKTFAVTDARALTGTKVFACASLSPAGSNAADELEMDMLACAAYCAVNGTIALTVASVRGPIIGQRKINYFLG